MHSFQVFFSVISRTNTFHISFELPNVIQMTQLSRVSYQYPLAIYISWAIMTFGTAITISLLFLYLCQVTEIIYIRGLFESRIRTKSIGWEDYRVQWFVISHEKSLLLYRRHFYVFLRGFSWIFCETHWICLRIKIRIHSLTFLKLLALRFTRGFVCEDGTFHFLCCNNTR
jgi:hypothetical protein